MSAVLNIAGMAKATMMVTKAKVSAVSSKEKPAPANRAFRRSCDRRLEWSFPFTCIVCLYSFRTDLVPRPDLLWEERATIP
jgi:hypothetical protein